MVIIEERLGARRQACDVAACSLHHPGTILAHEP